MSDESKELGLEDIFQPKALEQLQKRSEEMRTKMSPEGELGLPPALDRKRIKYGIPDSAFMTQPIFDRCHVWQVEAHEKETYGDTGIVIPDFVRMRDKERNPKGILLNGGPAALDALRSNGVELGDLVTVIEHVVFRVTQGITEGKTEQIVVVSASDICDSEDLRDRIKAGVMRLVPVEHQGQFFTTVTDAKGEPWYGKAQNPRSVGEEA